MDYTKSYLCYLYNNKEYNRFLKYFNQYLEQGYGVDQSIIYFYVRSLIKIKNIDSAYKLLKSLEKYADKSDLYSFLAQLYLYCFKPMDAERMISLKKSPIYDYGMLVKIYLLQGKIEKASEIVERFLKEMPNHRDVEKIKKYKKQIENHYKKGAYIETEYSCFINNGNILEPGHIVFIKNILKSSLANENDQKNSNRPYMIWKIEENKVYMFPVSSKCKEGRYKLFQTKYPNSIGDRIIKGVLCETTLDNILSVEDKVLEEDMEKILDNIFKFIYLISYRSEKKVSANFMKSHVGETKIYDIIEFVDPNSRNCTFYLVLDIISEGYKVIEIDFNNLKIIGKDFELFKKERLIYKIHKLENHDIENLLSQIPELVALKSLKGKKITSQKCKYIVVEELNNQYVCISAYYSPSYMVPTIIERDNIASIDGEVEEEELDYIIKLIEESQGHKVTNLLNRKIK